MVRSPRALRPQLGLGAVSRLPSAKNRMILTGQRSAMTFSHPAQMAGPSPLCYQDPTGMSSNAATIVCTEPSKV